jgi:hypothetical protein
LKVLKKYFFTGGLLLLWGFGCSPLAGNAPERRAQEFLRVYYQEAQLQKALELTDGLAHFKIQQQLELGGGQAAIEDTSSRKITWKQKTVGHGQDNASPTGNSSREFYFELETHIKNTPPIKNLVRLTLRQSENIWKISNFVEVPM